MKFTLTCSALVVLGLALTQPVPADTKVSSWNADPVHSNAAFAVTHLAISRVDGTIPIESASIRVPEGSNIPISAQAVLDAGGIDTHNGQRDDDLRSANFFDAASFPTLRFVSTTVTPIDDHRFTMAGTLTMHGVTAPITLTGEYIGRGPGPHGEPRIGYSATASLDRTQWGMTYGSPIVGTTVTITLDIEAVQTAGP